MGPWWRDLLRRSLVIAPMAGGPTGPELVVACAQAGALPFLAGGYKTAGQLRDEMAAVRAATGEPFGVNLFVPGTPAPAGPVTDYVRTLISDGEAVGAQPGEPAWDDDGWDAKVAALLEDTPPVVSFTFGCPTAELVSAFRAAGAVVAITVTSPEEARWAADVGADLLCVQGTAAGAHRGTFDNDGGGAPGDVPLGTLIDRVARVTDLPQVAAGGIMGPDDVRGVLAAGAVAAQCGTAFLRCPESGAHPRHKAVVADPASGPTVFTRAFSGRWARGIVNDFVRRHRDAPAAYPEVNNATRPIRAAAATRGDADRMSLWAGSGFRAASGRPAPEVVEILSAGTG